MQRVTIIAILISLGAPLRGQLPVSGTVSAGPTRQAAVENEICELRTLTEYLLYLVELRFTELRIGPLESRLKEIEASKADLDREIQQLQREATEIDPGSPEFREIRERENQVRQSLNEITREGETIRLDLDRQRRESDSLRAELTKRASKPRCTAATSKQ